MEKSDKERVPWEKISSTVVYSNPWFRVERHQVIKPDGKPGVYNVVESTHPPVFILPVTLDRYTYLVRLYR